MKKRRYVLLVLLLLLLLGVGLATYPMISSYYTARHQSQVSVQFQAALEAMPQAEIQADRAAAERYNRELAAGTLLHYTTEDGTAYEDILDSAGTGMMGYVEIPSMDVMLPIYHGTGEDSLSRGAGHMPSSSFPIGGEGTHAVISAHSAMPTARMFTDLDRLKEGDRFSIHVLDEVLHYEVDRIVTVLPSEIEYLEIKPEEDYVTLLTCVPYWVNTHRLLVRGHRVEEEPESALSTERPSSRKEAAAKSTWQEKYWQGILTGLISFLGVAWIFILTRWVMKRIHRRKREDPT